MLGRRVCRVLAYFGMTVSSLLAAAFAVSMFRSIGYAPDRRTLLSLQPGILYVSHTSNAFVFLVPETRTKVLTPAYRWPQWWLPARPRALGAAIIVIPLWLPLTLFAGPTVWLWRRGRRIPQGHCLTCGYNLTGNTSGRCPECGIRTTVANLRVGDSAT